jgi:hypothetical protein
MMAVNMTSRLVALMMGCLLRNLIFWLAVLSPEKKRIDLELKGKLMVFAKISRMYEGSVGVLK